MEVNLPTQVSKSVLKNKPTKLVQELIVNYNASFKTLVINSYLSVICFWEIPDLWWKNLFSVCFHLNSVLKKLFVETKFMRSLYFVGCAKFWTT